MTLAAIEFDLEQHPYREAVCQKPDSAREGALEVNCPE